MPGGGPCYVSHLAPEECSVTTFYRTLLGTIIYTIIIILAAPFPSAAGLFLTFPALNGLGFFFSPPESIEPMTRSMLWMPVINGALCAAYIAAFLALRHVAAPTAVAWVLAIAVAGAWLAIASRKSVRGGIARKYQAAYGIVVVLAGCALVAVGLHVLSGHAIGSGWSKYPVISHDFLLQILWSSKLKIALFAACLLLFLMATARLPISPGVRGILTGLPIVPFGGLLSVAADGGVDLGERVHIFERMAASIWLSPAIAVAFIYGYSTYLGSRQPPGTPDSGRVMKFAVLVAAWSLCGAAILGVAYVVASLGQPAG
jgi:hypothetical protein